MNSYIKSISEDVHDVVGKVRAELMDGRHDASAEPGRTVVSKLQRAEWALGEAMALLNEAAQPSSEDKP